VRSGPHRGKDWRELDEESLVDFAHDRDPDVRYTAEQEVARRRGGGEIGRQTLQRALF
jgi:exodeoxyribonuclease X